MKFLIKDFFSKFEQIRGKLQIWSYLLKKSLMENFIFCIVVNNDSSQHKIKHINLLHVVVSFSTLCKHQKTYSFLMFSGGIEREQRHEMAETIFFFLTCNFEHALVW